MSGSEAAHEAGGLQDEAEMARLEAALERIAVLSHTAGPADADTLEIADRLDILIASLRAAIDEA